MIRCVLRLAEFSVDGNLLKRTLTELIGGSRSTSEAQCPDIDRLASSVTCIRSCAFGSRRHLVAGDQDGSIRVWDDSYVCQLPQ